MEKILIFGHGEIGSAIGKILARKGFEIYFWDKNPERATQNMTLEQMVKTSDFVFLCVPSWVLRNALESMKSFLRPETILVSLAKGMENDGKTMDEVIKELVINNFVLMSGPMLAEEISQGTPGFAVLAAASTIDASKVKELFNGTNIHTEISDKVQSVAFAGVLKNVYALVLGIVSGLGFKDNLKGFLVSRMLKEWDYLAEILGLDKLILSGQAGIGDFIATSFSDYSKNRELGEKLAKGNAGDLQSEGLASLPGLIVLVSSKTGLPTGELPKYILNLKRIVIDKESAKEVFKFSPQE